VLLALAIAATGLVAVPRPAVAEPEVGGQLFSAGGEVEV
jgi:hypothetical protein